MNVREVFEYIRFRERILLLTIVVLALPFFSVHFVPSADLPQHLALFSDIEQTLTGATDIYSLSWYAPNTLIYGWGVICYVLFPPLVCGKIVLLSLYFAWISATLLLASARTCSLATTILASLFVFNLSLYWGLLSFLLGWPLFVLWLLLGTRKMSRTTWIGILVLSVLLYMAHALWFAVACAWLFFETVGSTNTARNKVVRLSALVPAVILAACWFFFFSHSVDDKLGVTAPVWATPIYLRLLPTYPLAFVLGGQRGLEEALAYGALGSWCLLGLFLNRTRLREKVDFLLLRAGILIAMMALILPSQYMGTIFFAERWITPASVLIFLALPAPLEKETVLRWYAFAIVVLFSALTALSWYEFEKNELSGLQNSLDNLPKKQRVLGLDYITSSDYIRGRPFIHISAYAQALKNATTNFSFVEHASIPIQYRDPPDNGWTAGLEWSPEDIEETDFLYFDYALVGGAREVHAELSETLLLHPVTFDGRWRLYKIQPDALELDSNPFADEERRANGPKSLNRLISGGGW